MIIAPDVNIGQSGVKLQTVSDSAQAFSVHLVVTEHKAAIEVKSISMLIDFRKKKLNQITAYLYLHQ